MITDGCRSNQTDQHHSTSSSPNRPARLTCEDISGTCESLSKGNYYSELQHASNTVPSILVIFSLANLIQRLKFQTVSTGLKLEIFSTSWTNLRMLLALQRPCTAGKDLLPVKHRHSDGGFRLILAYQAQHVKSTEWHTLTMLFWNYTVYCVCIWYIENTTRYLTLILCVKNWDFQECEAPCEAPQRQ